MTPTPPSYRRDSLRDDLLAAAIVAVLLIPQSIAYALLAGLPPQVGLYASVLPLVAYALVGASSLNAVGPAAVLALMTLQAIAPLAGQVDLSAAAVVLAAEVGLLLAAAAVLKLDALAALLSAPVLQGFSVGAAISIALSQLPALLGSPAHGVHLRALVDSWVESSRAGAWLHPTTAAFGVSSLVVLLVARRHLQPLAARWLSTDLAKLVARAAPLVVIAIATGLAWAFAAPSHGVTVVGPLPTLHLPLALPLFDAELWLLLLPSAALLALVTFVSSFAVAERLGLQRGEHVDGRRELAGLAAANLAAGVSGGMPVGGSFSRSALNAEAGARTRWAGAWTALFLALAALLLAAPLAWLPRTVLAATIVVPVLAAAEWKAFGLAWRYTRGEAALMGLVAAITVLHTAQWALGVGVLISIALMLQHAARPHAALIGRVPGTEHYRNVTRYATELTPGVLSLRVDESLLFVNARQLPGVVAKHLDAYPDTRRVVLQMTPVNRIDLSGLEALSTLQTVLRERGIRLDLSEVKGPVLDGLRAAQWSSWFAGRIYLSHHQAVRDEQGMAP
ncbi:SulP family inorganic anion transporter [Piscinibacter sp. HJYY11]|uniref:SulP family inorganic anion transporter n=1 Tax=Piscinibacter sp. HJYY11 TaxID=2801333 RepID=UPI001EEDBF0D|nr:SulP family inorganic anion transporter [Piscinibacter sp. HJYY11]